MQTSVLYLKKNLKGVLNSIVGGVMGFGTSNCTTYIEIDKNIFSPGETVKIKIECDNG